MKEDLGYVCDNLLPEEIERFRDKTVLLVGSNGFLGRWFYDVFKALNNKYLDDSCTVLCLDNDIVATDSAANYVKHNIVKPLDDLVSDYLYDINFIINCAGIASPEKYLKLPIQTLDVSYIGTKNILDVAFKHNVESILMFSSSEVYGTPNPEAIPTNETYIGAIPTMSNRSCYDIGKQVLETLCNIYHNKYSMPIKVVRPFNVYGPHMGTKDNRVLSNFMNNMLEGKKMKVYGHGRQTRTFCYAADAIVLMFKTLLNGENGEVYNVGSTYPELSAHKLAEVFCETFDIADGVEIIAYPDDYPSDEPQRRCPDISKVQSIANFTPSIQMEEGLRKMHHFFVSSKKQSPIKSKKYDFAFQNSYA